jgi:hypothetical protein
LCHAIARKLLNTKKTRIKEYDQILHARSSFVTQSNMKAKQNAVADLDLKRSSVRITNTIAQSIARKIHNQIKNAIGASSLFKRAFRCGSEFRSGFGRLRREGQGEQKANERGRMHSRAAVDVPAMMLPLGRPP